MLRIVVRLDVAAGVADGLEFYANSPPQIIEAILKDLTIRLIKLILHHVQVLDRQREQLALRLTLNRKLPFQTVTKCNPVINIKLMLIHEAADNA